MKLLDLPSELLQEIMKHAVVTTGFPRAFRLRLVCKLFTSEALRAIFATQLIRKTPRRRLDPRGTSIVSRYLTARTLVDATNRNTLIIAIRQTADTLISEREESFLGWDWSQLIHVLCCAATTTMGEYVVVEDLNIASTKTSVTAKRLIDTLAAAAYIGRIAKVRSMMDEGIDKSAESEYFGTPLEAAASGGHIEIVLLLLENGFDARKWLVFTCLASRSYCSHDAISIALKAASRAGHEDIVQLLSDIKYEPKDSHSIYLCAAYDAATMGHTHIVRSLLDRIKTQNQPRAQDMILWTASENGHEVIVRWMLDLGTNVHANQCHEDHPIHRAAAGGHDKVVQLLLDRGAKQVRGEYGFPLHEAARGGFVKVAQMLIDHGADIDALAASWRTPIASAAESGNVQMVRFLIEKGADLCVYGSGPMALCHAARDGQETIVRLLVECGVHVDGEDDKLNALLNAILEGHDQVAKALVELGAKRMDPLKSNFVKQRARYLAEGCYPYVKARKSYHEYLRAYQRLDKALFPSESASPAISSPLIATTMEERRLRVAAARTNLVVRLNKLGI